MVEQAGALKPQLSVIICIVSDARHLEGCLESLLHQVDPPSMEIIVPYSDHYENVGELRSRFPDVIFHHVEKLRTFVSPDGKSREHHDELRGIGMNYAKGEIIALLEDHGRADAHWARNVVNLHTSPYAAVGGAIGNEVDRPLNWAVYFCDFGRYQNPVPEGPSDFISDANISYKREALEKIRDVWKDIFHETSVNSALKGRGEVLWLSPDVRVNQHRENVRLRSALLERYVWGRSYAGTLSRGLTSGRRLVFMAFSPVLPFLLTLRKTREALNKKSQPATFIKVLPLIFLLLCFWSAGEFTGYLTGRPNSLEN